MPHVLLVEDYADNRVLISELLDAAGMTCTAVTDGKRMDEALAAGVNPYPSICIGASTATGTVTTIRFGRTVMRWRRNSGPIGRSGRCSAMTCCQTPRRCRARARSSTARAARL